MTRSPRFDSSWLGRRFELEVGPIAHGGHCVARVEGRVVFVRYCLPGELVVAEVTEDGGGSYCRADAVEIITPDPDRVAAPCSYAHPGGCGGCDFQHVSLNRQRRLKSEVVIEQFRRLARLDVDVDIRPVTGQPDESGLGWRRRVRYAVGPAGDLGLRAHRSHTVVPVDRCLLGSAPIDDAREVGAAANHTPAGRLRPGTDVEAVRGDSDALAVLAHRTVDRRPVRPVRHGPRSNRRVQTETRQLLGPSALSYAVGDHVFGVAAGGFWQTHPAAAAAFTDRLHAELEVPSGARAIDLYAGAGLFTAMLAAQVGPSGRVLGLEADRQAVEDAAGNLARWPHAEVRRGSVTPAAVDELGTELGPVDVIVLDPPRTGAGAGVMNAVLGVARRVVGYVACDPAALARDVGTALAAGWRLDALYGYDAFPMTHHVECIAVLRPAD